MAPLSKWRDDDLNGGVVPFVFLDLAGKKPTTTYAKGRIRVVEDHDGKTADLTALAALPVSLDASMSMKIRGNYSATWPKPGYAVELQDDAGMDRDLPLVGLPPDSDWVFFSGWAEGSALRNPLSHSLYRSLVAGFPWNSRTRFVEVVLNGSYQGLFLIEEKIKTNKWRINIPKPAADAAAGDLTGGYVFKLDPRTSGVMTPDTFKSTVGTAWTYVDPDYKIITPAQIAYIKTYVDKLEALANSAAFTDPQTGYRTMLDVPSFVHFAMLQELHKNVDSYWKSAYFSKDPDSKGGKLHAGPPWDFDNAYGAYDQNDGAGGLSKAPEGFYRLNLPRFWQKLWADPAFQSDLRCRWDEARAKGPFTMAVVDGKIAAWKRVLAQAQPRDQARWGTSGWQSAYCPTAKTYQGQLDCLRTWIDKRLAWLDTNLPGSCKP